LRIFLAERYGSTSVTYFTDLPAFPFAPLIVFWAEQETGFKTEDIDATKWIAQISPRPVFLMQGGADVVISPSAASACTTRQASRRSCGSTRNSVTWILTQTYPRNSKGVWRSFSTCICRESNRQGEIND
jgi:hypothetical protein